MIRASTVPEAAAQLATTVATDMPKRARVERLLPEGTLLGGTYVVERPIAHGGMGQVYAAEHLTLGRRVAVKVPKKLGASGAAGRARVVIEARAAARVAHPGSVAVLDCRDDPGEVPFFVMEYLEGPSLSQVVAERRSPEDAVGLVLQLLDVLGEAHANGVVHRDVKTDNVLVTTDRHGRERVKLVDYGLALVREGDRVFGVTRPGVMYGTPGFMSPEQARGEIGDARTDIYAAGVVLHALLTGTLPGAEPVESGTTVPSSRRLVVSESVPRRLASVLRDALAADPARRPPSAFAFASRLRGALDRASGVRLRDEDALDLCV